MVLDLNTMSVNSKPGSHTQLTYKEKDYWVKEIEMHLTEENYELDSNTLIFDDEDNINFALSILEKLQVPEG